MAIVTMPAHDPRNYYDVLGVLRTATPEEIGAAFRALARQCHPDVCPGDADAGTRFKRLNEAHEILADPEKRRKYDQGQARPRRANPPTGFGWNDAKTPAGGPSGAAGRDAADLGPEWLSAPVRDLLDSWLQSTAWGGPAGGRSYARRSTDIEAELPLTPEEAVFGGTFECTLSVPGPCPACGGRGGWGAICCDHCGGQGWMPGPAARVRIEVPPGVSHGSVLRVPGAGQTQRGTGRRGDLYLHVRVESA